MCERERAGEGGGLRLDHTAWRKAHAFARKNGARYVEFARRIQPRLDDPEAVLERVAFAILSANIGFDAAAGALAYASRVGWHAVEEHELARWGMVHAKARALRALPSFEPWELVKQSGECWHEYRLRLQRTVPGLGLCKASFAAALLYPLEAEVACIDMWMQRLFGLRHWHAEALCHYRECEQWLARFARHYALPCTFVAQWLVWDSMRGTVTDHMIWPRGGGK